MEIAAGIVTFVGMWYGLFKAVKGNIFIRHLIGFVVSAACAVALVFSPNSIYFLELKVIGLLAIVGIGLLWRVSVLELTRGDRYFYGAVLIYVGVSGAMYTSAFLKLNEALSPDKFSFIGFSLWYSICGLCLQFLFAGVGAGLITNAIVNRVAVVTRP